MTCPSTTAARSGPVGATTAGQHERGTDGERRHGAANRESHEQSFRQVRSRYVRAVATRAACPTLSMTTERMTSPAQASTSRSRNGRPPTRAVIGLGTSTVPSACLTIEPG